jgi:hypothetical protein
MTLMFIDAMTQALALTARYLGIPVVDSARQPLEAPGGTVMLVTEFGPEEASAADLNTLNTARANKDITGKQYRRELLRRGVLEPDFDEDEHAYDLDKEKEEDMMDGFGDPNNQNKNEPPPPDVDDKNEEKGKEYDDSKNGDE